MKKTALLLLLMSALLIASCSNNVVQLEDKTPPAWVQNVQVVAGNGSVSLFWTTPADNDFFGTRITFEPAVEGITQPVIIEGDCSENSNALFNGLNNGTEYTFTLVAVDKNQNKGEGVVVKVIPVNKETEKESAGNNTEISDGQKEPENTEKPSESTTPKDSDDSTTTSETSETNPTTQQPEDKLESTTPADPTDPSEPTNPTEPTEPTEPKDNTPPADVVYFVPIPSHKKMNLVWYNPEDEDFFAVEITCEPAEGTLAQPLIIQGSPSEKQTLTVDNLDNDKDYCFTIKTIDTNNNKSNGLSKTKAPVASTLSLQVSLPNDDENIVLTNNSATINVVVSTTDQILKAVWKKGLPDDLPTAEALLSDTAATELFTDSRTASFSVTENGVYDIAMKNGQGITDIVRTEIKTIDKSPLGEIKNLNSSNNGDYITLTWENPEPQNQYDSPLQSIKISYVYNNDESDSDNGEITLSSECTEFSIRMPDNKADSDFVIISAKTVDKLGHISQGCSIQTNCTRILICNASNVEEQITAMTKTGKVVIVGECDLSAIKRGLDSLKSKNENILVELDLSETGLTVIGTDAFLRCSNLLSITIPTSLQTVADGAFNYCSKLKTLYYSGTLEQWCTKEWNPYNVSLAYDLYINNQLVVDVTIPENLTEVCENVFSACSSLKKLTIPNGITTINTKAFYGAANLIDVTIPESVTSIGVSAFSFCRALTEISIPSQVSKIEDYTFYGSQKLETVDLPSGLTEIGKYAFYDCTFLTNIEIPDSVNEIEEWAFHGCSKLRSIRIPANLYTLKPYVFSNTGISNIEWGNRLFSIQEHAFDDCGNLASITIPDTVYEIENHAFMDCTLLKNINFGNNVSSIGNYSFSGCTAIQTITIPGNISVIGDNAFRNCTSLTKINLSEGLLSIGQGAFNGCTFLRISSLPDSVKEIGKAAFYKCLQISSFTIGNNVTDIGDSAFSELPILKTFVMGSGIKRIGAEAFRDCPVLENVILPEGLEKIGERAFSGCSKLTAMSIPDSVTSIGKSAFRDCVSLEEIKLPFVGNNPTSEVDSEITRFNYIFYGEGSVPETLTKVTISRGKIAKFAFMNNPNITTVVLGNEVKSIGLSAFAYDSSLEDITIGTGVTSINNGFSGCSNLKTATFIDTKSVWYEEGTGDIYSYPTNLGCMTNPTSNAQILRYHERLLYIGEDD